MAGRPPGGLHGGSSGNREDLLLDLDNDQPVYNDGQRSALNDDDLMRSYTLDHEPQSRPSVSYDDFVGSSGPSAGRSAGAGLDMSGQSASGPYRNRQYSQSSELGNYQRYADDFDDFPADSDSYYHDGGAMAGAGPSSSARGNARNRNSVLSLGGGLLGRVKNKLGMGQGYSEMDLPLTEPGQERGAPADASRQPKHRSGKFDMGNFKFGFGKSKPDPSTLGPRIIHLNNPPANSANKYVDNHISTAKYNVATFLPKFLLEQFLQVCQHLLLIHGRPAADSWPVADEPVYHDRTFAHRAFDFSGKRISRGLPEEAGRHCSQYLQGARPARNELCGNEMDQRGGGGCHQG